MGILHDFPYWALGGKITKSAEQVAAWKILESCFSSTLYGIVLFCYMFFKKDIVWWRRVGFSFIAAPSIRLAAAVFFFFFLQVLFLIEAKYFLIYFKFDLFTLDK